MATWTENGVVINSLASTVLADCFERRANYEEYAPSLAGSARDSEAFLLTDADILFDLMLTQKWGL